MPHNSKKQIGRCLVSSMRNKSLFFLMVGCLILPFAGCSQKTQVPEVKAQASMVPAGPLLIPITPAQEKSIGLTVGTAEIVPFTEKVLSNGQVEAANYLQAHIYTPAAGRTLEVPVQIGQFIQRGQALSTLKSDQVGQIEADLLQQDLQNNADIRQARVQLKFSKNAYERENKLFNDRVSAKADLESAYTQYEKDKVTLKALLAKQQATIATAQERLSLYGVAPGVAQEVVRTHQIIPNITISAPRSGVLIARNINKGELADPSKELFTIADLETVWLSGNIYERDIEKVHTGQPVTVTLDSIDGQVFKGHVNFVSSIIDPLTRTLEVRGEVANTGTRLKPNMFVRMAIEIGNKSVLAVPKDAVQRNGDFNYVYVPVRPNVFQERKVLIGDNNGEYIEVLNGLKAGEKIAVQGTMALKGEAMKLAGGMDE